jgi:hypothetical protein
MSWSIVMVENPIIGPKVRPFSMHLTVYLNSIAQPVALILKRLSECTRFCTFQHFHQFFEILDNHFFHHLPHSHDPL